MSQPNLNEDLNIVANSNIEITLLDGDLNIIQQLDDEPNDVGGLTAAELKAKFDEAGNIIKTYINGTLIPEILAEDATEEARAAAEAQRETNEAQRIENENTRIAAEQSRASAETARDTAEQAREAAEQARADETSGIVSRATEQANIASREAASAGNSAEAAGLSATSASESASAAKASETTAKSEADRAKSEADRAAGIVGGDYVTKTELAAHTGDADIHVTAEEKTAWSGKAEKAKCASVTLTASGWDSTAKTQTVAVTGVLADEAKQFITPTPALASQEAYYDAGIHCTGQAADSLTFTYKTVPTADLTVYVVIQEVGA